MGATRPLLLQPGVVLGVSWLVNPVLGALTLLVVYRLGMLVYGRSAALLAPFFMLFSPFFFLHSASYFAHPSSLLFIALFVLFYATGIERKASRHFLLAGLCGSMSFLIRPFDQVAAFSPLGAYLLFLALRREVVVRQLLWFGMSHAIGVLLLLAYNYLQTGNRLTLGTTSAMAPPSSISVFSGGNSWRSTSFISSYGPSHLFRFSPSSTVSGRLRRGRGVLQGNGGIPCCASCSFLTSSGMPLCHSITGPGTAPLLLWQLFCGGAAGGQGSGDTDQSS